MDVSSHRLLPRWLEALLSEKFFNACIFHENEKKNEKNIFCLDCCTSICSHCLPPHRSHRLLQIRRYVYHDVIRMDDAAKLIDCSLVQSYTTNSAKVVFLHQRAQTKNFRGSGNVCTTCDRTLQDQYLFCSLSCKIHYLVKTQGGLLPKYLFKCTSLPLPEPVVDDVLMTPNSVLELDGSTRTSSGSAGQGGGGDFRAISCTATTEIVRKKRSSISGFRPVCSPASEISAMNLNRRKGTPQRAPLY